MVELKVIRTRLGAVNRWSRQESLSVDICNRDIIHSLECVEYVKIVDFVNTFSLLTMQKLPFSEHYGNSFHCTIFAYRMAYSVHLILWN